MPRVVRSSGINFASRHRSALSRIQGIANKGFLTGLNVPKISLRLDGIDKVTRIIKRIEKNIESSTAKAIEQCSKLLVAEAKLILRRGKYRAFRTGKLHDSVRYVIETHTSYLLESVIGSDVPYAVYVHEGTYLMDARPYLRLAFQRKEKMITKIMLKAIREDLTKGFLWEQMTLNWLKQ